jgi:lysozyme
MIKPAFVDLSHHNAIPSSLEPAAASGILGVIHKASEGWSMVDDKLAARRHLALEAGLLWGTYHFIRPGSVDAQVAHYLEACKPVTDDNSLYVLDWEDRGVSADDALAFLEAVEQITGHLPVLYTGFALKDAIAAGAPSATLEALQRFGLWLAQYGPEPELPPGWSELWAWQYTDQGSVAGITPPTDLNAYPGTADELAATWSGAAVEPEPEPEAVEITVIVPDGVRVRVVTV